MGKVTGRGVGGFSRVQKPVKSLLYGVEGLLDGDILFLKVKVYQRSCKAMGEGGSWWSYVSQFVLNGHLLVVMTDFRPDLCIYYYYELVSNGVSSTSHKQLLFVNNWFYLNLHSHRDWFNCKNLEHPK